MYLPFPRAVAAGGHRLLLATRLMKLGTLEHIPAKWNRFADQDTLQIQ